MDFGLTGKRALVTGSTAGIGLATAKALLAEGAHVTVNGRTQARVGNAVDGLQRAFPRATIKGIVADLSMRARNWGRIVFVSSESALQIPAEMIHYGMTKTAQLAVARGLAETLAGTGVTVNSVLPGPTASEVVGSFVAQMA
jgi:NAD(P)-dependent dehydrogenase (short-subunit alcohol dehydrogenase family)